MPFK